MSLFSLSSKQRLRILALAPLLWVSNRSDATVLTFDLSGSIISLDFLPQEYGDNVNSPSQSFNGITANYGSAGGSTPNVSVAYAGVDNTPADTYAGDLTFGVFGGPAGNVAFNGDVAETLAVTLTASGGNSVSLSSFRVGNTGASALTVSYFVEDTLGHTTPFSSSQLIGAGSSEILNFSGLPITATELRLTLGINTLGLQSTKIYLDDVTFSQNSAVPEPKEWAMIAGGSILGWAIYRNRKLATLN